MSEAGAHLIVPMRDRTSVDYQMWLRRRIMLVEMAQNAGRLLPSQQRYLARLRRRYHIELTEAQLANFNRD